MSQKLRQDQILAILAKRSYVTVRYLTDQLHYSSATINRDLNKMEALGLVKRSYGGVEAAKKEHLPALPERQFYMKKEKRRIAAQPTVKAEKQESEGKIRYAEAKKLTSEIRKAEKRIEKAEAEIEGLEEEKSALEEEMNSSAATDYVRLSEISERISEIDARIDELFFEMEEAEAFLAENKNP